MRTENHTLEILDFIKSKWQLDINEEGILESVLSLFAENKTEEIKQLSYLLNEDEDELLETLYQRGVEAYACREFGLISEDDEDDLVEALKDNNFDFSSEVSDKDMIASLENDGWTVTFGDEEVDRGLDNIDDSLLGDITEAFLAEDLYGRQRMRDLVINRE